MRTLLLCAVLHLGAASDKKQLRYIKDQSKCARRTSDEQSGSKQSVEIYDCGAGDHPDNNLWKYDSSKKKITNVGTGECLDVYNGKYQNGNPVVAYSCTGKENQKWDYDAEAYRVYHYVNNVYYCLDLPGADTTNKNYLWLWECNGLENQMWGLAKKDDGPLPPPPPAPSPTPSPPPTPPSPPPPPPTPTQSIWDYLNEQIRFGGDPNNMYRGGKGIIVRSPFDGYEDDTSKIVVPGTFWVNDIFAASQLYPGSGGDIWCPNDGTDGWFDASGHQCSGGDGPWKYAQIAYVVASKMSLLFKDFDRIQDPNWGNGVFYASDANTCDKRCRYSEENQGYDCPGYWQPWDQDPFPVSDKLGAGGYHAGNPFAGGGGGGAGCHFEPNGPNIDQDNVYDSGGVSDENLVQDRHCQCNYFFNQDWSQWVNKWISNGGLLHGGTGPSWVLDLSMCWTNNPRDMIHIQNQLWWNRDKWSNQRLPIANYFSGSDEDRKYWGWNEIPVERSVITTKSNWDTIMIKLPAALNGDGKTDTLDALGYKEKDQLVKDFDDWVSYGYLTTGKGKNSMVVVREWRDDSWNYFREFFCQNWSQGAYKLVQDGNTCYLDRNWVMT